MDEKLKTGTTTVALKAKDCVILAADTRVTVGGFIPQRQADKLIEITNKLALSIAGHASIANMLAKYLRSEIKIHEVRTGRDITIKEAANLLGGWTFSSLRTGGIAHFLMAGADSDVRIYDIFPDGSVTSIEDYHSSGSGSVHAISILDANYKKDMSQEEAIKLTKKCIVSAMNRDSASGNGYHLWIITKDGITKKIEEDLLPKA